MNFSIWMSSLLSLSFTFFIRSIKRIFQHFSHSFISFDDWWWQWRLMAAWMVVGSHICITLNCCSSASSAVAALLFLVLSFPWFLYCCVLATMGVRMCGGQRRLQAQAGSPHPSIIISLSLQREGCIEYWRLTKTKTCLVLYLSYLRDWGGGSQVSQQSTSTRRQASCLLI